MKLANISGRLNLIVDRVAIGVAEASENRFGPDPQSIYENWSEFVEWVKTYTPVGGAPFDLDDFGPPVPRPAQVFAIGVNYVEHAAEAGYPADSLPVTFTKFPTCLTGPAAVVALPSEFVDWEVELVIVISRRAEKVSRADAWDYVAGLTIGQDLSERQVQMVGTRPQFSMGKSFPGFGPTGPWLVTVDEFEDPNNLEIGCSLSGKEKQHSRTSNMIYDVSELIVRLSAICTLLPGDIIFTGTPSGIGNARSPKEFVSAGDVLESSIEGIGSITTTFSLS